MSSSDEDEVGNTSENHSLTRILADLKSEVEEEKCKLEAIDRKIDGMTGKWLREYNNNKGPLTLSDIDTYPTPRLPPQELSVKVECESQTLLRPSL